MGSLSRDAAGRWIWQPLLNPSQITNAGFPRQRPSVCIQRDDALRILRGCRSELSSQAEAPSSRLQQGLEGGRDLLAQIPTGNEFLDNIVAFWSPPGPVEGGTKRLERGDTGWSLGGPGIAREPASVSVVNTFVGRDVVDATSMAGQKRFIVDFKGSRLDRLKALAPVAAKINSEPRHRDPRASARSASMRRKCGDCPSLRGPARSGHSRCAPSLHVDGRPATETWSYQLDAEQLNPAEPVSSLPAADRQARGRGLR